MQHDRLTQEVCVWRKVNRQVVRQVKPVTIKLGGQTIAKARRQAIAYPAQNPYPGECAESDLQGACPIDPSQERIVFEPGFEQPGALVRVFVAASEKSCHGEHSELLMPIQFPDNFVIANLGRIEIRELAKVSGSRFDTAHIIFPPGGLGSYGNFRSKHGRYTVEHTPGHTLDFGREFRSSQRGCYGISRWKKLWLPGRVDELRRKREQPQVFHFLPHAEVNLVGAAQLPRVAFGSGRPTALTGIGRDSNIPTPDGDC